MSDKQHALEHRPAFFELRDDLEPYREGASYTSHAESRWPEPFPDDDLDVPEEEMWWQA